MNDSRQQRPTARGGASRGGPISPPYLSFILSFGMTALALGGPQEATTADVDASIEGELGIEAAAAAGVQTGDAAEAERAATPETVVDLKDGSRVVGEVIEMIDGQLKVKTAFGGDVPIKWSEVSQLSSPLKLRLVLKNEDVLNGAVEPGADDTLKIRLDNVTEAIEVPLRIVDAINPPAKKPVTYSGNLNLGGWIMDGNTRRKSLSTNGEFVARSERQRLTLRAALNYAEDRGELSQRNASGRIKYDFFLTERVFLYASSLFEGDEFQDLNLRTALSSGVGYQFLNRGDVENEFLRRLEGYAEVGVSYFNEDFDDSDDNQYVSGRWALDFDWEILPDAVSFFHRHEGYPSFEDSSDVYITSEQGVRFTIWKNFIATLQVNWRWDNTPASGQKRSDTMYLATLGYKFAL